MQKIRVRSELARRNIELFQQIINRYTNDCDEKQMKVYAVFINRVTGMMQNLDTTVPSENEWAQMLVFIDLKKHQVEMVETDLMGNPTATLQLAAAATKVMQETASVLREMVCLAEDYQQIAGFTIETVSASDIVHEAWHQVNRVGAEKLLLSKIPGSFLFRKDEYANLLEEELGKAFKEPIKCITLTFLDRERIVRDRTIVLHKQKWTLYDDNPNLDDQSYNSIADLLYSLKEELTSPVLHIQA